MQDDADADAAPRDHVFSYKALLRPSGRNGNAFFVLFCRRRE